MKLLLAIDLPLRWRDLDSYQHVNNSVFLTLFEEARIHWFGTLAEAWRTAESEPVIARVELDYLRPMHYPDSVRVSLYAEKVGRSSLCIANTLSPSQDPDLLYAKGKTVLVWVDPKSGMSVPLPASIRAGAA